MEEQDIISRLEEICIREQLKCHVREPTKEFPFPCLITNIGDDAQGNVLILETTVQKQQLVNQHPKIQAKEECFKLQFLLPLPSAPSPVTAQDVGSLILFLNRTLELPGFELSEIEERLYYRVVWLCSAQGFSETIVLGIVGNMLMVADLFNDLIDQVASGKKTFDEVLTTITENG